MFGKMLAGPALRSMLFKFIYGFLAAIVAFSQGWLGTNTDPQAWTIGSFYLGLGTAVIAFAKDFIFRVVMPTIMGQ